MFECCALVRNEGRVTFVGGLKGLSLKMLTFHETEERDLGKN